VRAGKLPEQKDVVVALLGAAASLGGLVLVFLGVTVTTVQSYDAQTPRAVLTRFRILVWFVVGVFLLSMVTVVLATLWLLLKTDSVYWWTVWSFFVQVFALAALAAIATRQLLRV
jgi:hypothetical protein